MLDLRLCGPKAATHDNFGVSKIGFVIWCKVHILGPRIIGPYVGFRCQRCEGLELESCLT